MRCFILLLLPSMLPLFLIPGKLSNLSFLHFVPSQNTHSIRSRLQRRGVSRAASLSFYTSPGCEGSHLYLLISLFPLMSSHNTRQPPCNRLLSCAACSVMVYSVPSIFIFMPFPFCITKEELLLLPFHDTIIYVLLPRFAPPYYFFIMLRCDPAQYPLYSG